MKGCQVGHKTHDTMQVATDIGELTVFDTAKYMDQPGMYCPGQDVVSQAIADSGCYGPDDTRAIGDILAGGDKGSGVIDFGAHIGWYTVMAAQLGYTVLAIEGNTENHRLLRLNTTRHNLQDRVTTRRTWVDQNFRLTTNCDVELVKIDLESMDRHAVNACMPFIERVRNLYVEISPIFRPDYPELVADLADAGFTAFWPDGRRFDDDYTLTQFNLRFSRCE